MLKKLETALVLSLILGGVILYGFAQMYATGMVILGILYFAWSRRSAVYIIMANLSFRQGGLPAALNWFRRAHKTKTMDYRTEVTYGFLLLKSGAVDEGERVLSALIGRLIKDRRTNELSLARSYHALASWKKGDLRGAIDNLRELLAGGYRTTALYGSLGYFLIEQGQLPAALELNLEAREFNGDDKVILDNLGCTYLLMNELDRAEEVYSKLMDLQPHFPEAWYNFGKLHLARGRRDEARQAFARALELPFNALSTVTKAEVERAYLSVG